jgi:ferritin-like metal-binding protein YciE
MATQGKRLDDLFYEALKDIYYAENKIVKALPKMAKAARSKDLQTAFEKHKRARAKSIGSSGFLAPLIGRQKARPATLSRE